MTTVIRVADKGRHVFRPITLLTIRPGKDIIAKISEESKGSAVLSLCIDSARLIRGGAGCR
jgi:hypothetical protein